MPSRRPPAGSLYERLDELLVRAEGPMLFVPAVASDPPTVALLSGSFDPMTIAHAALADAAAARADLVLLVYAARTLPKDGEAVPPLLSGRDRLRTMEAFARDRPKLLPALASHGLLVEQAEAARLRFPLARLFLIMGSDKALQILDPKWYPDPEAALSRLFGLASVLYADRSGEEGLVERTLARPEHGAWRSSFERLPIPPEVAAVSSREVRDRLLRGEDVRPLVPPQAHPFLPQPG